MWSLATNITWVQSPISIASLCVAVTSPSFSPRDSLGFYLLSCLSFLAPSFSFRHNPSCLWKLLRGTSGWTHRGAFSFLQTQSLLSPAVKKKCKQMRSPCKNVLVSDVRESKQDVGSDHLNGDQPQCLLLNPVTPVVCSDRGVPPASLSSIWEAKCLTRGSLDLWTLTLIQTWTGLPSIGRQTQSEVCFSEQDPTCSSFLVSTWSSLCTWLCGRQMHIFLHRNNIHTKRQSDAHQDTKPN